MQFMRFISEDILQIMSIFYGIGQRLLYDALFCLHDLTVNKLEHSKTFRQYALHLIVPLLIIGIIKINGNGQITIITC